LAFSRKQRDKVYVQHLMRKREAQLWRWLPGGEQACVCDVAAENGNLDPDAGQAHVRSVSADTH
jgi:sulfite reductase (NADPH) flavoprotein alpha-component